MRQESASNGCFRNRTLEPVGLAHWAGQIAASSPPFHDQIDRLRYHALGAWRSGYERTTGELMIPTLPQLERLLAETRLLPQEQRPRAWRNTDLPTDEGLSHVHNYIRGCRKLGRYYLAAQETAPLIHTLVGGTGYSVASIPITLGGPAPTGPIASNIAALLTGASWGVPTQTLTRTWHRIRTRSNDTFHVYLDAKSGI